MQLPNLNLTQIRTSISGLGTDNKDFKTIKINKIAVITSTRESTKLATEIAKFYAVYKPKLINDKHILVGNFEIVIKEHKHQRSNISPSISNEYKFVEYINQAIKDNSDEPLIINFRGNGRLVKFGPIVKATHVGATDTRQGYKADAILWQENGSKIPISLKQDDATFWGSPDQEIKPLAERFFKTITQNKLVNIKPHPSKPDVFKIDPLVGFKLNDSLSNYMIFGNDIRPYGAVIMRTWKGSDFDLNLNENGILNVSCTNISRSLSELPDKYTPYFVLVNDASRKVASTVIPPGLRYLVAIKSWAQSYMKIINFQG